MYNCLFWVNPGVPHCKIFTFFNYPFVNMAICWRNTNQASGLALVYNLFHWLLTFFTSGLGGLGGFCFGAGRLEICVFWVEASMGAVIIIVLVSDWGRQAHSGQQSWHTTSLAVVVGAGLISRGFGQAAVNVIIIPGLWASDKPVLDLDLSEKFNHQPDRV